jgi:hypothetical protein
MGNIAKSINDQVVEIFEQRDGRIGEAAEIGEIGGAAKAVTEDIHFAVEKWNGNESDAEECERAFDFVEKDARDGAEGGLVVENVGEGAADDAERFRGAVNGHGSALADVEGAKIVEAEDVVSVAMGEEDGFETIEMRAEGLGAEVGGGVNDDVLGITGEKDRGTEALVVGVGGITDGAVAANRGNAHGGAGAQDGEVERRRRHEDSLSGGMSWGK